MAWYPEAIARPIPPGSNDPAIIPVGVVLHVDAGNAASLYDYFDGPSGGIESHFHVQRDGDIEQYRDTHREADANYDGNSWFSGGKRYGLLSVETQGFEHGEWTDAQVASIKDLIVWAAGEHDFPLQVAPSWRGPGVGYHVMWGAPGRWTPVAKTCPGPDRVKQFHAIITPWLRSGAHLEDDMTPEERKMLRDIHRQVGSPIESVDGDNWSLNYTLQRLWHQAFGQGGSVESVDGNSWSQAYATQRLWHRLYDLPALVRTLAEAQDEGLDLDAMLARLDQHAEAASEQRQQILAALDGADPAEAKLAAIVEILGSDD